MQAWLDRYFGLTEKGTKVSTEVLAGVTTFLSMSYIVLVNPAILSQAGLPIVAVAAATCASAAFASILMGLLANYPLALAPGMGLNAYFTFTVVKAMGVPWETALGCVFLSGVAFLLMTFVGVRQLIVNSIPRPLFSAVAGASACSSPSSASRKPASSSPIPPPPWVWAICIRQPPCWRCSACW